MAKSKSGPPIHPHGAVVRLRYKDGDTEVGRLMFPYHNRVGIVSREPYGPGKLNHLVILSGDARKVNVPAGNLKRV